MSRFWNFSMQSRRSKPCSLTINLYSLYFFHWKISINGSGQTFLLLEQPHSGLRLPTRYSLAPAAHHLVRSALQWRQAGREASSKACTLGNHLSHLYGYASPVGTRYLKDWRVPYEPAQPLWLSSKALF